MELLEDDAGRSGLHADVEPVQRSSLVPGMIFDVAFSHNRALLDVPDQLASSISGPLPYGQGAVLIGPAFYCECEGRS